MTSQLAWMGFMPRRSTTLAFAASHNHSSDAALRGMLLHEAMHRLQHCRQPELTDQLDADHSVIALEEEAMALQNRDKQEPRLNSSQQAANAALGFSALVIGRPITNWLAPAAIASAGPITLA